VDGDFEQRAVAELERLVEGAPGGSKTAAALDALVGGSEDPAVRALVERDEELGASIALGWRDDFQRVREAAG
jgi:hypothetical protein